jgi:hypothetical protein
MKKRNIFNIILDGREVGSLDIDNGKLKFTGNTDESAKIFFEQVIKHCSNDSGDADWWKKCDE